LYLFPKLDLDMYKIKDDQQMVLDFLIQEKILLVQGTAFNWPNKDHFRIVFLPREDDLTKAINRFGEFLSRYSQ
jgi:alanine-synthesizing transaminase